MPPAVGGLPALPLGHRVVERRGCRGGGPGTRTATHSGATTIIGPPHDISWASGTTEAGRLSFATYVTEQWFPNHVIEPSTREGYTYCLDRHILPWFGQMKMRDILPMHVRQWVTELAAGGVSPAQIRHLKIILSAVFTTALNDFVVAIHPCRGVKTPTVPVKEYRIVTPAEYERSATALPSDTSRLLVEVSIGTGLRWGELSELRRRGLNPLPGILAVTRAVAEINPKYHPAGRYRHGTLSDYSAARCRCEFCRSALADYRARRRTAGLDSPRGVRRRDTDGHIPRDWFRSAVWHPACDAAGVDPRPRMHDLRHSHASWLLAGGADLQVVRERLGHVSIATTSKYLHTLPTADETALDALRLVRYGRS